MKVSPLVRGHEGVVLGRHLTGQSLLAVVGVAAGDHHVHTCTDAGTRGSSLLRDVISRLKQTVNVVLILKAPAAYLLHARAHPPCR